MDRSLPFLIVTQYGESSTHTTGLDSDNTLYVSQQCGIHRSKKGRWIMKVNSCTTIGVTHSTYTRYSLFLLLVKKYKQSLPKTNLSCYTNPDDKRSTPLRFCSSIEQIFHLNFLAHFDQHLQCVRINLIRTKKNKYIHR